jgi:hypothetical protein
MYTASHAWYGTVALYFDLDLWRLQAIVFLGSKIGVKILNLRH